MRYNLLGNTGLYVSELCLGSMTFGGANGGMWQAIGRLDQQESLALVSAALDAGVNFIDTADVYSEGESERLVGKALKALGRPREQIVVATKVRGRVGPGVNQVGLSRSHILSSIDASLTRLGLDHVDLYQIHGFDPVTPIEETVRALDDVVRSGKARYVGFSNLPAWVASHAITFAEQNNLARFQSAQVYYSIAGRDIERELAPMCRARGLAILPWSPLAGGLLSGKFDPDKKGPADARRANFDFPPVNMERLPRVLTALRQVAAGGSRRIGLAAHSAVRDQHHHRRQEARAARGQPGRDRAHARGRASEAAGPSQRAAPRIPRLDGRFPKFTRSARLRPGPDRCPNSRRRRTGQVGVWERRLRSRAQSAVLLLGETAKTVFSCGRMKISSLVLCAVATFVLPACGKSKAEQCNAFVDRATQAQNMINALKLDSEDAAVLEKGATSAEAEAKAFSALELKDEKLIGYRASYAATLASLGKIMHDLAALQKDAKDPAKLAALEAESKKIEEEASKVEKSESDVVDQVNMYCTGSK